MAKISLRATGGLNKDFDPNNLPQGDYSSASNIVFDSGKSGGAGAIRLMESITSAGITIDGIKETCQDVDGSIYVLGDNGTTASIYKIPTTLDSKTLVLTYTHNITGTVIPDLKIIGKVIVWNYAEMGTVLSFSLTETFGATYTIADLKLAKQTSSGVVSILKTIGTGRDFLEANDFQFASRYQYKTKEYSALSNFSQIYKGVKGTASYTLSYDFSAKPTFAENLEVYVRIGNDGIWRRIDTQVCADYTTPFEWAGQTYESLDSITTGKPFDAIPVYVKHIEVAKNRIFLGNIKDDYDITTANLKFDITADTTGYTLPSGGTAYSYISGASLTSPTSSEISYAGTDYVKPFANNSTYAAGIAFYDAALKTRGVEKNYVKFTTGKFAYPMVPTVTVTFKTGWLRPSWAKYAQLVYTKNATKSFFYEGFASNIYFQINRTETNPTTKETTTVSGVSQSVTTDQLKDIQYFVVDLMGMYRAGRVYTLSEGDRITINTPSPNGLLDMKIKYQQNNLLYCEYNGGAMTNLEIPDPKLLFFEIYSPKQIQEDESLVFYEYGNLVDISSWGSTTVPLAAPVDKTFQGNGTLNGTTTSKLIGDTVFSFVDIPSYSTSPFVTNYVKDLTVDMTVGAYTNINAAFSTETLSASVTRATVADPTSVRPIFTNIGINNDGAVIKGDDDNVASSGRYFSMTGFYEVGTQTPDVCTVSINYKLKATQNLTITTPSSGNPSGSISWKLKSQMYRVPYDNATNLYTTPIKFGNEYEVANYTYSNNLSSYVDNITKTQVIDLSSDIFKDVEANDKFYIILILSMEAGGLISNASVSITKQTAPAYGVELIFKGNRKASKAITTYNNNAKLNTSNTKFVIRSISNATAYPQWNTSAGKPLILTNLLSGTVRTNTIRYGGNYVAGTNINDISSFFSLDSNDVSIENGEIMSLQRASRLQGNGAMLLVLCQKETAYIMLGEQELSQGNNASIRALTSNMIGTIRNFNNNLGIQDKGSVMNYKGNVWWWDNFNKKIVKYTPDGLEIVSDTYMRSHFLLKSGVANFSYDPFYNMCFVGIGSDTMSTGYSDNLKRWIAEYSFRTDHAESYGDKIVIFKGTSVYKPVPNTTTNDYNNFLGTTADGSITFVVNSRLPMNPLNVGIWHNMNVVDWANTSNYVKTNLLTINITNENNQSTNLVESNFLMEDNRLYAHVLRNVNSYRNGTLMTNAIIEGDYIVGYLNKFVVTLKDKTQNMRINSIDVELAPVSGHS